jgi:UDPglucose 6-dehydrogenase
MAYLNVIGAGVVGQATGKVFAEHGHRVTFVDIKQTILDDLCAQGHTVAQPHRMDHIAPADAFFVTVPTPTGDTGLDTTYLEQACVPIGESLRERNPDAYPVVVFRSTMLPGTTRTLLIPALESVSGKRAGADFGVCYNPEYLRARQASQDFRRTTLVTIGCADAGADDLAVERLTELYKPFGAAKKLLLTYEEAEFQKYVHNCYNAVKISFFNEMRMAAKGLGIDPDASFEATAVSAQANWDPWYGVADQGAYGGACLPKDMNAWINFAERRNLPTYLTHAAREINRVLGGE